MLFVSPALYFFLSVRANQLRQRGNTHNLSQVLKTLYTAKSCSAGQLLKSLTKAKALVTDQEIVA